MNEIDFKLEALCTVEIISPDYYNNSVHVFFCSGHIHVIPWWSHSRRSCGRMASTQTSGNFCHETHRRTSLHVRINFIVAWSFVLELRFCRESVTIELQEHMNQQVLFVISFFQFLMTCKQKLWELIVRDVAVHKNSDSDRFYWKWCLIFICNWEAFRKRMKCETVAWNVDSEWEHTYRK